MKMNTSISAAIGAWGISFLVGSSEPVMSAMSALVMSQIGQDDEQPRLFKRVFGAVVGVAVSLTVTLIAVGMSHPLPLPLRLAMAAAICAGASFDLSAFLIAMWVCSLILLAACTVNCAMQRSIDVVIGVLVCALLDWTEELQAE